MLLIAFAAHCAGITLRTIACRSLEGPMKLNQAICLKSLYSGSLMLFKKYCLIQLNRALCLFRNKDPASQSGRFEARKGSASSKEERELRTPRASGKSRVNIVFFYKWEGVLVCGSILGSLYGGSHYFGSMSGAPDFWKLPRAVLQSCMSRK